MLRKLPVELLQRIFLLYLQLPGISGELGENAFADDEGGHHHHIGNRRTKFSTPIHLSVVCRRWRLIALSMPRLWSWVVVRGPAPRDVAIFDLWLRRSGVELLDIEVHEDESIEPDYSNGDSSRAARGGRTMGSFGGSGINGVLERESFSKHQKALIAILFRAISESTRWKGVSFTLQGDVGRVFQSDQFLVEGGGTPNLREFNVNLKESSMSTGPLIIHSLCEVLCSSPQIRKASWGSFIDNDFISYAPFHRLTSLSFEFVPDEAALEFLPLCQELKELSIQSYGAPPPNPSARSTAVVVLPKLEIARLNFMNEFSSIPTFFQVFITPSLEELYLDFGFGSGTLSDGGGWDALAVSLRRSGCVLKKLRFCPGFKLSRQDEATMRRYLQMQPFTGLRGTPWRRSVGVQRPERREYFCSKADFT